MREKKKKVISDLGVKLLAGATLVVVGVCIFTAFAVSTKRASMTSIDMLLMLAFGLIPTGLGFYMLSDGVARICHTVERLEALAETLEEGIKKNRRDTKN